ncbi:MAG: hypothetical protein LQ349_005637, partial [Xanthoria aureola]
MAATTSNGADTINSELSVPASKPADGSSLFVAQHNDNTERSEDDKDDDEMPEEADNGIGEAIIGLTGSDVGWLSSSRKAEKEEEKAKEKEIFGESKRKAKLATSNSCQFPVGEEVEYLGENAFRTTNEEKRHLDRMNNDFLEEYRHGAEVHRQVRQWAQKNVKPGQSLTEIAEGIENGVRALTGHQGLEEGDNLKGGMWFPTGLSLNHCAAHFTPNAGNKTVLQKEDVMKIDFGVHINGRIVDSAFTMAFDPIYDNLLAAAKDAINAGVREAGIDVRMSDIGAAIQEAMESYEVELGGQSFPVKCIRNLNGHDIIQYSIHGRKVFQLSKVEIRQKWRRERRLPSRLLAAPGKVTFGTT